MIVQFKHSLQQLLPNQLLLAVCRSIQSLLTLSGRAIFYSVQFSSSMGGSSAQLLKFWLLEDAE